MDEYEHLVQLYAIKNSGPPMDAFMKMGRCINCPKGYIINPMLLELLHSKIFAGDGTKDPYNHIEFFAENCETFILNLFTKAEENFILFG